jgi:hypothetical protein
MSQIKNVLPANAKISWNMSLMLKIASDVQHVQGFVLLMQSQAKGKRYISLMQASVLNVGHVWKNASLMQYLSDNQEQWKKLSLL